jgi:hypothetical protein
VTVNWPRASLTARRALAAGERYDVAAAAVRQLVA